MRLNHRQRTGLFRYLPLFFAIIGAFAGVLVASEAAQGAAIRATDHGVSSASDGSEDPDALFQLYLEYMLRKMKAPVPAKASSAELARMVVLEYRKSGAPDLESKEAVEFVDAIISTQALLREHPDLLDAEDAVRLNSVLESMLADLSVEGRVAP